MPAIVSGALMSFTLSLDELIVTYFTASAGTRTLPLEIFGRVKKGLDPSLNAISTVFILVTVFAVFADRGAAAPQSLRPRTGRRRAMTRSRTRDARSRSRAGEPCAGRRRRAAAEELNLFAWSEYVPQAVLDGFTKETGIQVNYETYASNEEMLAKLLSGAASYDLIQPSEYTIEALVKEKHAAARSTTRSSRT